MKTTIALVVMCLCAAPARAEWPSWNQPTKGEVVALLGVEALITIDCAQTVKSMGQPGPRFDLMPLIGRSTPARAGLICGLGGLATAVLWYAAPSKMRYIVVGTIGVGELAAVGYNFSAGLRFGF